jgi:hypothetical protein
MMKAIPETRLCAIHMVSMLFLLKQKQWEYIRQVTKHAIAIQQT